MKFIFTLFACWWMTSLLAETVGFVEYQLPQGPKEWEESERSEYAT